MDYAGLLYGSYGMCQTPNNLLRVLFKVHNSMHLNFTLKTYILLSHNYLHRLFHEMLKFLRNVFYAYMQKKKSLALYM